MEHNCLIYLSSELSINLIEEKLNSLFSNDCLELILLKNSEYDILQQKNHPDGFLFFKYILDINFLNETENVDKAITTVNSILIFLWGNNISAVASCDYEELLIKNGGYKDLSIPWPN